MIRVRTAHPSTGLHGLPRYQAHKRTFVPAQPCSAASIGSTVTWFYDAQARYFVKRLKPLDGEVQQQKGCYNVDMSQAQKTHRYSVSEYFALERDSEVRHDYLDGEIVAMGGASRAHNTLVFNLATAIRPHLRGTPCRIGGSDMKVFIAAANRAYYPDLAVSCGDPAEEVDEYTETRPLLIVEVLSPATAATDRTEKRLNYQRLDTMQEYVLIAQREPLVDANRRQLDGWTRTQYGAGDEIELTSIDLGLPMSAVCEDISLPANRP